MKTKLFTLFLALIASVGTMSAAVIIDGIAYNLNKTKLTAEVTDGDNYSGNIVIPSSVEYNSVTYIVTSVSSYAFYNCRSIISVTIPNSVTSIGVWAFSGCTGLTSITIPNSVTSIGDAAFWGCNGLTSIEIPNSVISIGESVFNDCTSLASATIGSSVTSIGDYAFRKCSNLRTVKIYANAILSKTYDSDNTLKNLFGSQVTIYIIGDGVTSIGGYAFYGCSNLTYLTIPNSVTRIEGSAFSGCTGLTSIVWNAKNCNGYNFGSQVTSFTFGDDVEVIPASICSGMTNLTSITIPNSVTSIGDAAFSGCTGLTSVEISNSVTSIGDAAFYNCKMSKIYFNGDIKEWIEKAWSVNQVVSGSYILYIGGKLLEELWIPNSVTSIGEYAFYGCSNLIYLSIPNSVTSIGEYAFYGCSNLMYLTIPSSVTSIGHSAFDQCPILLAIFVPCEDLARFQQLINDDIVMPMPSPYSISTEQTKNGSVTIQEHSSCDEGVVITAYPDKDYHFVQWSDGITDNPRTIILTQDTTFIAQFAANKSGTCGADNLLTWEYDDKSRTLTIGGKGALTDNYTFGLEAPSQMTTLIIGDEMTAIGDSAFYGIATINHLFIGANVASIGNYAFAECRNFDDITCYATIVPVINATTFENVGNKKYIYLYVPAERERAYKRDIYWGEFDVQIKSATTTTTDEVKVAPTETAAAITWPVVSGAASYELVIKDKEVNVACTLIFNAQGQLTSIAFPAPTRNNVPQQTQAAGFSFTVTGLKEGTGYDMTITAKNNSGAILKTETISFYTNGPEGLEDVLSTEKATKLLRNGQILILRGEKTYTLQGQEVK